VIHTQRILLPCLAILLCLAETASGAFSHASLKCRVEDPGPNPDIRTYIPCTLELELQGGDTIIGYDPASGVVFYVRQNPWSNFDPLGLNKVVVSGGINEDLESDRTHDLHWGNFVESAKTKVTESQRDLKDGEEVEWHVQRSSLIERAKNEGKSDDYYTSQVSGMASDLGVSLRWFDNTREFVNGINSTSSGGARSGASLITDFTYYGHGNDKGLWLTYNRGQPGQILGTTDMRSPKDLVNYQQSHSGEDIAAVRGRAISPSAFAPGATSTSWACNSGVSGSGGSFIDSWHRALGVPMRGVVGRTDYTPTHPGYRKVTNNSEFSYSDYTITNPTNHPVLGTMEGTGLFGIIPNKASRWVDSSP
jgi:hypothetical protein